MLADKPRLAIILSG